MEKYDVIVVGAGISGMCFAHYAAKAGQKVLVLEKANRSGGSFHTAVPENTDFWLELGAHTCYNSYRNLIEVMEDCGIQNEITTRAKVPFKLLIDNQVKSFTSRINFFELLTSLPRAFSKKKDGETVETYYGGILGTKNFKKVFSALFSAVPSQNANEFPADALFKKRQRRKDVLKHYTLKNGLESIARAIENNDNIDVKYDEEVKSVEENDGSYTLNASSDDYTCHKLALCAPVTAIAGLTQQIAPELSDKVKSVKFQEIESFGVVVDAGASNLKPFAGLVPVDDDFFSAVSRDTVPSEKFRGFTFHFKPGKLTSEQKNAKVCEVLGIAEDKILHSFEKTNIVPSLRLGHYDLVTEIDQLLKGRTIFISGNYFAGLSIEDCVSRSKEEVERMLKK